MQLEEAIEDRLAIEPKVTWPANMLSPQEGLPSGEQFRAGSWLDNARQALSADGPKVKGIGKDESPSCLGKVRMGSRMTRAIREQMELFREWGGW